jgi:hypothetical protein
VAAALLQSAARLTARQRAGSAFPPADATPVWAAAFAISASGAPGPFSSSPAGAGPTGCGHGVRQSALGSNCLVLTAQLNALTLDGALADARAGFERLYPGEPFLLGPAPDAADVGDGDDDI